jgi:hypothetical protein
MDINSVTNFRGFIPVSAVRDVMRSLKYTVPVISISVAPRRTIIQYEENLK